ncbi:MAG: hypothetical protein V3U43_10720 [Pseudomonadales bacterium]
MIRLFDFKRGSHTPGDNTSQRDSYGTGLDRIYGDEGWQQFIEPAASTALTPTGSADYVEFPGLEVPYEDLKSGVPVLTVFKGPPRTAGEEPRRITCAKALNEKHGAVFRAGFTVASDPFRLTGAAAHFSGLTEYGRSGQSLQEDPEWQAFQAEISSDPSSDFLRHSLCRFIA